MMSQLGPASFFSTDDPEDRRQEDQPTIYRTFECALYGPLGFFDYEEVLPSDPIDELTQVMQAAHDRSCGCGQKIIVK